MYMHYRNCIGQHFAILEIKVAVAHILNRFVHLLARNLETHYSKPIFVSESITIHSKKLSFNMKNRNHADWNLILEAISSYTNISLKFLLYSYCFKEKIRHSMQGLANIV